MTFNEPPFGVKMPPDLHNLKRSVSQALAEPLVQS